MMNNNLLITTEFRKNTLIKGKNVFFLGEWCNVYNKNNKIKITKAKAKNIPWHWSDRKKIKKDYNYLKSLYENIFNDICKKLNIFHEVNYPHLYWRIIIGPWLIKYISVLWDRWESVRSFGELQIKCTTFVPSQNFNHIVAKDHSHAHKLMHSSDKWNYFIYSEILKIQNYKHIHLLEKKIFFYSEANLLKNKNHSFLYRISSLFDKFLFKIFKNNSNHFVFYKTYLPRHFLLKLFLKISKIPRLYAEFEENINFENKYNLKRPYFETKKKIYFENFLYERVFYDMPKIYLENYQNIDRYCKSLPSTKIIFTANAHMYNDIFNIWTAQQVSKGSKLILSDHGGSLKLQMHFFEHDEKICNKKIVWHKPLNSKHIQLSPNKLLNIKKNNIINKYQITLIGFENHRYAYVTQTGPVSSLVLDDFNQKIKFINYLDKKTRAIFKIRPYPNNLGWFIKDRFTDLFGKKILSNNTSLRKELIISKLLICTYPETTFSEAMHSGVPTILICKEELWNFDPSFYSLIVKLKEASIFHSDPIKAANHVNKISNNPQVWWNAKKTKEARSMFFRMCGTVSHDPLSEWFNFFKNL